MRDISHILFQVASSADQSTASTSDATFVGPVEIALAKNNDVVHGRGLIATRDIKPGECLFVTPPTVSAKISEVQRLWSGCNGKKSIEEIAEASLLKNMKRSVKANDKAVAASFMALTSAHSDDEDMPSLQQYGRLDIDVLLGNCLGLTKLTAADTTRANDKNVLLGIMRHNAFGPDYHNYARIEETWTTCASTGAGPYRRILGMYPLAAIINHSCASNAVKVFAGEVMAVHANAPISKGEEIVWSYIPATQPYHTRQEQISEKFGFQCKCKRCVLECEALDEADISDGLKAFDSLNVSNSCGKMLPSPSEFEEHLQSLETLLSSPSLPNEAKRCLRLGCTNFFINYFNAALQPSTGNNGPDRNRILPLAMNLHFSFVSSHNASTEHLSILHLCYELAAASSTAKQNAEEKARATKTIVFWTDQLKISHQIRYGELGNDITSVREAMKHTRVVLRNRDGLQSARWGFI